MPKVKDVDMSKKVMFGAPLTMAQIHWIKQVASKAKTSNSEVLRNVVDFVMVYEPKEFDEKLVKTQLKRKLEEVSSQLATLERAKEEIENKLNV